MYKYLYSITKYIKLKTNQILIGCINSEPDPGWVDNINGPPSVVVVVITRFLKTLQLNVKKSRYRSSRLHQKCIN